MATSWIIPKEIQVTTDEGKQQLAIPGLPPLAVLVQEDYTHLSKALPDSQVPGAKSHIDQVGFPQQISVLWGGKIAPPTMSPSSICWPTCCGPAMCRLRAGRSGSCAACLSGCASHSRAPGCWCGSGGLAAPALFEFLEAEGCDYAWRWPKTSVWCKA
jgi:hypothetical protein